MKSNVRELALFNLAIDSKLRACDLTRLRVQDVCHGSHISTRATVMQQKTQRPVQFEITEQTRASLEAWIQMRGLHSADCLFPSRLHRSPPSRPELRHADRDASHHRLQKEELFSSTTHRPFQNETTAETGQKRTSTWIFVDVRSAPVTGH